MSTSQLHLHWPQPLIKGYKYQHLKNKIILFMKYFVCTGCPKVKCVFWKCSCSKTVNHIDWKWWFLKSQDNIFWYSCLIFAKKEMIKIFIWRKKKFLYHKFFFEIFWKKFFALNPFLGWFKAKKNFPKKFQKNFWPKKNKIFFQIKIFDISFFFFAKIRQGY